MTRTTSKARQTHYIGVWRGDLVASNTGPNTNEFTDEPNKPKL